MTYKTYKSYNFFPFSAISLRDKELDSLFGVKMVAVNAQMVAVNAQKLDIILRNRTLLDTF